MKESLTSQLSRGVEQLSPDRSPRDPRVCPRCRKRAVIRDGRHCGACGGRLLFPGDTGNDIHGQPILSGQGAADWFIWHRSIFGFEGWFHRSYWNLPGIETIQPKGYL